jgi:hypothetical protein
MSEFGEEDKRQEVGCGRMLPSLSLPASQPPAPCDLQAAGVRPSSSCLNPRIRIPRQLPIARVCADASWSL